PRLRLREVRADRSQRGVRLAGTPRQTDAGQEVARVVPVRAERGGAVGGHGAVASVHPELPGQTGGAPLRISRVRGPAARKAAGAVHRRAAAAGRTAGAGGAARRLDAAGPARAALGSAGAGDVTGRAAAAGLASLARPAGARDDTTGAGGAAGRSAAPGVRSAAAGGRASRAVGRRVRRGASAQDT